MDSSLHFLPASLAVCHIPESRLLLLVQAVAYLQAGIRRKVMAAHSMNASSSRSHCIYQLHVDSWMPST